MKALTKNIDKISLVIYNLLMMLISGMHPFAIIFGIVPFLSSLFISVNNTIKRIISVVSVIITILLIFKTSNGLLIYTALITYIALIYVLYRANKVDYTEKLCRWLIAFSIFTIVEISSYNTWKVIDLLLTQDGKKLILVSSLLMIEALIDILNMLIGLKYSALIIGNISFILAGINYFTMSLINKPFRLDEIGLAGTALEVVTNYKLSGIQVVRGIIMIIMVCIFNYIVFKYIKNDIYTMNIRVKTVLINCILLFMIHYLWLGPNNVGALDYMPYDNYGTLMGIANSCKRSLVEPKGYEEYNLLDFDNVDNIDIKNKPNIIIIMNEAFSDLSVVRNIEGVNIKTDVIPYTSEIMNNTQSGYLYSSVWGNNTVSSEFEAITGIPTAFVTTGAKVYNNYMNDSIPSLAKVLNNNGYSTYGVHPYNGNGYNRLNSWDILGFENKIFIDDFSSDSSKVRQYISDEANYNKLYEITEGEDNPTFIFNITMQNHGGYSTGYSNTLDIVDTELANYMSLLKESDKAVKKLIDYYSKCEENTIIVFFGDHQPSLTEFYKDSSIESNKYKVPYFIWSNYNMAMEDIPDELSINYLPSIILHEIGVQDKWFMGIHRIMDNYPVISDNVYKDKQENVYLKNEWQEYIKSITPENETSAEKQLKIYESLSYKYVKGHN